MMVIAGIVLVSGCAMKGQRVSLVNQTPPNVLLCGDALQSTLGIAPVVDNRPKAEKVGDKPHGVYLLLWNQRIGDYVTSDKDFLDPVSSSMAQRIGYSISRTNCFFETKVLTTPVPAQPSVADLLTVFVKEKVQFVLVPELKHFYGRQRQKAYFYAVPAYFVNMFGSGNETGTAEGFTEFLFTVYDTQTGQEVWREKITGQSTSPLKGSYPQVAGESFAKASEELANQIYRFAELKQRAVDVPQPERW